MNSHSTDWFIHKLYNLGHNLLGSLQKAHEYESNNPADMSMSLMNANPLALAEIRRYRAKR